ncbi:MAG: hypothetical protein KC800_24660 [Candidatus Eremiobacteraeota bacterium]|nr:hypothetical protein [Candidatus Eremiobacteraeota bacterium]
MNISPAYHSTIRTTAYAAPKAAVETKSEAPLIREDGYQGPGDKDWVDAGKLLREHNVPAENHSILQENIATYLAHSNGGIPTARWENKLKRELASPYTDDEVFQHVERLEDSLQANIRELPEYPSRVFVTGSFAKGRLGANSDLDGFSVVKDQNMSAGFDSYEKREENPTGSNLFPLSENAPGYTRGHLLFTGQSVEMTPEQIMTDGSLRKAYDKIRAGRTIDRRETSASFEWVTGKMWGEDKSAKEKREAFESKSLKTRLQNGVMSLGGTLSATPLVGPVVNYVCDKFAAQKHLDFTGMQL